MHSTGSLTFVDGEPLYTDRGPAVMAEEREIKKDVARDDLQLLKALKYTFDEEENMRAFSEAYCDENVGDNALFDPWETEWPPPESLGLGWLEDIEHDVHVRCKRGLPAERVFHSDPWQQRWWEHFQVAASANLAPFAQPPRRSMPAPSMRFRSRSRCSAY